MATKMSLLCYSYQICYHYEWGVIERKKKDNTRDNYSKRTKVFRLLHTDVLKTKYSHTFTLAAAILETHKNKIAFF